MKKNYLFRTIFMALTAITVLVDFAYIIFSLAAGITGISFFGDSVYGFEAIETAFMLFGYVCWPILLGCLVFNIFAITYLVKTRHLYSRTEHIQYVKALGRKMRKPVLALLLLLVVGYLAGIFMDTTYYGAVLKLKLGESPDNIYRAEYLELDFSEGYYNSVFSIEKNGTLIYVNGQCAENENIDFLKELYYKEFCEDRRHPGYFDISEADKYVIWDKDGLEIETIYKKEDTLRIGEEDDYYWLYKPLNISSD